MRKETALFLMTCIVVAATAPPVAAQCRLCAAAPVTAPSASNRPLSISVTAELDFSRAAHTGASGGAITINPATGSRSVSGALEDLGGASFRAIVRLSGEPRRRVRVQLPTSVRLNSAGGDKVDVTNLVTSLGSDPILGPDGTLEFSFGGKLQVGAGAEGDFHGRVQIVAEYQ
jgi:hypothetical protein